MSKNPLLLLSRGLCALIFLFVGTRLDATVFTVTNLTNSNPSSFRDCINQANASPGLDTIRFSVVGTISILSGLPGITSPVYIDGTSAPGYAACGFPQIVVNGSTSGANGIQFFNGGSGSTLEAITVQGFPLNGVQFIDSDNNTVQACFIGTNQFGTAAVPNGLNGIQMEVGSDGNLIGGAVPCQGNLISGNGGAGISGNSSSSNSFFGNLIGVDLTGANALGNSSFGILLVNGSNNCVIGAGTLPQRNIVSNNGTGTTGNGINIDGCTGTIIRNNYVGLDVFGNVAMGNAENGMVVVNAPNTIVGGTGTLDGNFIADHNFHGIVVVNGSNNCTVQGNVIGTNAAGTAALGNDDSGVIVINCTDVTIGGTATRAGNLLSGSLSEYGVFIISSSTVTVQGNLIGTDITGTQPLPNFDGGVRVDFGSDDNTIGGSAAGARNTIAFNTGYGVGVLSNDCSRNLISRNSMFCNDSLGIVLAGVGNDNHPSPVISVFDASGASGTAQPFDQVELFYDSLCVASACQGKDFIASVTADAGGNWSFVGALNSSATLVAIAIRTTAPGTFQNNTSEATCISVLPVEWASFTANPFGRDQVFLEWETTAEQNASHFEVERSADGANFFPIGEVVAENSAQGSVYDILDPRPRAGLNYYRLRQVDLNGAYSYSEVRMVNLDGPGGRMVISPNPVQESIRFQLPADYVGQVSWELYDSQGKVVRKSGFEHQSGQWAQISAQGLPAGWYSLSVRTGNNVRNSPLVVIP